MTQSALPIVQRKTFCGICEASCGLIASVREGTVVDLKPDADHPSSRGFVCKKGVSFHHVVADVDRVVEPLRRMPDGSFEPATWDEAFDDIGTRLRTIIAEHGRGAVGGAMGNPSAWNFTGAAALTGLAVGLKTKHLFTSASVDVNNYFVAAELLYGQMGAVVLPDFAETDFALILGANPAVSKGSMVTTANIPEKLRDVVRRGGRVVVVDPRRTETARPFEHLAILPDSDVWLLGAIMNVLFTESLIDKRSVEVVATGVDELAQLSRSFDIDRASEETGIPADEIRELARDLAAAPSAVIYGRCGTSLGRFSTLTKVLLDALAVVTGNFDRRGGMVFGESMFDQDRALKMAGMSGRARWRTRVGNVPEVMGATPLACLPEEIETPGPGKLRALVTMASNIAASSPQSDRTIAALEQLDLLVCLDPYVTETSRLADWILPPTLWLEREQMPGFTHAHTTVPNAQWVAPVAVPRGNARDDWWILDRIGREIGVATSAVPGAQLLSRIGIRLSPAAAMDLGFRTGKHGDLFGLRRTGLSRKKLMKIQGAVTLADRCPVGVAASRIGHDDGRVHLYHEEMADEVDRVVDTASVDRNRLLLFTIREPKSHNTWLHNVPELAGGRRGCRAMMNPVDASRLGVSHGGSIDVRSDWGAVTVALEVTPDVVPGALGMTHGWGHRGGWRLAVAGGGANYNVLTPTGFDAIDRPSGNARLNGIPVSVCEARL